MKNLQGYLSRLFPNVKAIYKPEWKQIYLFDEQFQEYMWFVDRHRKTKEGSDIMKNIILIATMILANALFACTACKDTGKLSYFVPCEHCKGTGMVGTGSGSGVTSDYRVYSINLLTGDNTLVRRSVHIKCSTVAKKCIKCSAAKTGYVRKQFPCWK